MGVGVNGASRRRTPAASKMALVIAAPVAIDEASPPPSGGLSRWLISTMSTSGTSRNLMIG